MSIRSNWILKLIPCNKMIEFQWRIIYVKFTIILFTIIYLNTYKTLEMNYCILFNQGNILSSDYSLWDIKYGFKNDFNLKTF